MYYAYVLCVPLEFLLIGSVKMIPLDPSGTMIRVFQSYLWSRKLWYADVSLLVCEVCRRWTVITACVVRWFYNYAGQFTSVKHRPLMKWLLNAWMTHSVAFTWWVNGSANFHLQSHSTMYTFSRPVALLSIKLNLSMNLRSVSSVNN